MNRREFISGLGSAAAWPVAARAQQTGPMRRIGVLSGLGDGDRVQQSFMAAFQQGLAERVWTDGGNIRIDYRWGDGDTERIRASAAELVALHPDVLFVAT